MLSLSILAAYRLSCKHTFADSPTNLCVKCFVFIMVSLTHHQIVICHSSEPPRFSSRTAPTDERVILLLFCDVFSGVRETSPPGSVQPEALLLSFVFLFVIVFSSDVLLHFPQQAQAEAVDRWEAMVSGASETSRNLLWARGFSGSMLALHFRL